jgi:hypothetical protein
MEDRPPIAFQVERQQPPPIEIRVNFGVFAGRDATPAELDRLADWLLDEVDEVSIVAEERHELAANVEASVHQVVIQFAPAEADGHDALELTKRMVERAEHWARLCVSDRHADVVDGAGL